MTSAARIFFGVLASICTVALVMPVFANGEETFRDIKMTPERDEASERQGALRIDAREVADLLNITPMIERLRAEKSAGLSVHSREVQQLRLLCMWRIFIASEEVRKAVANIDLDLAIAYQQLDQLTARQMSVTNTMNQINFMQGGILGIVKNCISLPGRHHNPVAAQEIVITTASTSMALSVTNMLIAPRFIRQRIDSNPNMLSYVFDAKRHPADAQQSYLWRFFNARIPRSSIPLTRREILIRHWQDFAGLRSTDEKNLKRLSAMTDDQKVMYENIRLVNQRIDLLQDMKTHIEEFEASIFELHNAISMH